MLTHLLNGLSAIGNLADLPGSSARDVLAGRNPFDQWASPLHDTNRTSGRDLLRHYGMAGEKDTWGNFLGGMAAETVLDPLNVISGKGVLNALRARRGAQSANAGIRSANATSLAQRARGYLPEEAVEHISPLLKTTEGTPKRMYHGTSKVFDKYDLSHDSSENLFGKGVYTTDSPQIASEYADKWGSWEVAKDAGDTLKQYAAHPSTAGNPALQGRLAKALDYVQRVEDPNQGMVLQYLHPAPDEVIDKVLTKTPQNVRMQYLNVQKPFDMEASHAVKSLPSIRGAKSLRSSLDDTAQINREALRDYVRFAKDKKSIQRSLTQEDSREISRLFAARHAPKSISGNRYARYLEDAAEHQGLYENGSEIIPKVLRKIGYDGIVHGGGKRMGNVAHNVAIAFDPSQVHQPYIAKRLASELPVPSAPLGLATGMAAHNVAARGLRPPRRRVAE